MNVEAKRPDSSSESASSDVTGKSSEKSSRRSASKGSSLGDSDNASESSTSKSIAFVDKTGEGDLASEDKRSGQDSYTGYSSSQESIKEKVVVDDSTFQNGVIQHSESESSVQEEVYNASPTVDSGSEKELLRSVLSDSASEKIDTDIDVVSPKEGKFSSSTDDELLKKFREQQVNRRFRPRSAKFRRDADPEPEVVNKVSSKASDRDSNQSRSYSSDSSSKEDLGSGRRRKLKPRKASERTASRSSASDNNRLSSRSRSPSLKSYSSEASPEVQPPVTSPKIAFVEEESHVPQQSREKRATTGSETSDSLTTNPTSVSESTRQPRPPSRQRKPPKSRRWGRTESKTTLHRRLYKKADPLASETRDDWPKEPGFWWPYNEDTSERDLRRLIAYHEKKLHNLLAQEYLQRHLEIELRNTGAQFKQYERGPRPLSPKQVRRFKEKNVTWIYLDGKLHNLEKDMGGRNTTQRGRSRTKVNPNKAKSASKSQERNSKSSERSKRSVSFEKGAGKSSEKSDEGNVLTKLIKGLSPRRRNKKSKRRGSSGSGSRRSSLSSKGSARSLSRSSSQSSRSGKSTPKGKRSASSSGRSRSRSRSSSRGSRSARNKAKILQPNQRPKTAHRPKSAKPKRSSSSASKSSMERRSTDKERRKKTNGRSSSSASSERKSKKSADRARNEHRHYTLDEDAKLNRVLFTEDYDKKWKQQRKEKERVKFRNDEADRKVNTNQRPSPKISEDRSPSQTRNDIQVRDDYNFYRDPNIPGHAFPYQYLSYLLAMEKKSKKRAWEDEGLTKIVLKPAPVNKPPIWRTYTAKPSHSILKQSRSDGSPYSIPKPTRKKKTKSVINENRGEKSNRSSSRESQSSSQHRVGSHPRIRPGSGPIKCSWKASTDTDKPKYPGSDHQLKNTDNPAILAWLHKKDAQLRARRQNEIRKQRRKTAKLIDEQNDLEDKHELALKQYELWKKNKDREILLRRRKEAKEANSVVFSTKAHETITSKFVDRPRTAKKKQQKAQVISTFSELRSSSANPNMGDRIQPKPKPLKQRPKSAATRLGVSFCDEDDPLTQRPKSATPHKKDDRPEQQTTDNFFKRFLEVDGSNNSNAKNNPTTVKVVAEDRRSYDKWVRDESASTKSSSKLSRKKQRKNSPHGRSKNKQQRKLSSQNHSDNDLISNLAKRRIESILASRKRVDTGLKKRPKSADNGLRKRSPPPGGRTGSRHGKWKLREDDITTMESSSQHSVINSSSSDGSDNERPKFSFSRKSSPTSTKHHRNPVIREALSGQ